MITRLQVKHIQSLDDKKYRQEHRQFIVEGDKMVSELLTSDLDILEIYALEEWFETTNLTNCKATLIQVQPFELEKISSMTTPNNVLAIVSMPRWSSSTPTLALLLDGIQDPGNMGSIIRIADWYGIDTVYVSETSADVFNPKVIQASMGGVFRIHVVPCDLINLIKQHPDIPSYAAVLEGNDINSFDKITHGFIIIGNESKGVREELKVLSQYKISIQRKGLAESLNAAVATGIICHCMIS
jgi:TrmH family RNA methyltransferase